MAGSANSPQSPNSDAVQSLVDTAVEETNTNKQDALNAVHLASSSSSTLELDLGLKLESKAKLNDPSISDPTFIDYDPAFIEHYVAEKHSTDGECCSDDEYGVAEKELATEHHVATEHNTKADLATASNNQSIEDVKVQLDEISLSKAQLEKTSIIKHPLDEKAGGDKRSFECEFFESQVKTADINTTSHQIDTNQSDTLYSDTHQSNALYSEAHQSNTEQCKLAQKDTECNDTHQVAPRSVWREIWSKRMGICLVTGFASGMPLFVLINLLAAFLRKEGLDLKTIGVFSLIMFPYTWKFLWAPFVDRFSIFHLGRRKDWIILSQVMLIISIGMMGMFNPNESLWVVSVLSIVIAFSSATQDIVLDAYRREFLPDYELGLGNAIFVNAYRVAGLVPGGISLILADYVSWQSVFMFTAACLIPCLVLSLFLREQELTKAPRTLKDAVVEPFREFITRRGLGAALFIVCFVFLYKIGDSMALALATPFYMDLGYDLTTIGIVAKNVGLWSTVIGGLLGGVFMLKLGINRALWVFGVIQVVTILGFVLLAHLGQSGTPSIWILALVLIGEYGGGGLGTSAFVAFIAKETNPAYTATQLALLSSFSAVPRTFCNATTGYLVEGLGWENFFIFCTVIALPGMLLLFKVAPWRGEVKQAA